MDSARRRQELLASLLLPTPFSYAVILPTAAGSDAPTRILPTILSPIPSCPVSLTLDAADLSRGNSLLRLLIHLPANFLSRECRGKYNIPWQSILFSFFLFFFIVSSVAFDLDRQWRFGNLNGDSTRNFRSFTSDLIFFFTPRAGNWFADRNE